MYLMNINKSYDIIKAGNLYLITKQLINLKKKKKKKNSNYLLLFKFRQTTGSIEFSYIILVGTVLYYCGTLFEINAREDIECLLSLICKQIVSNLK